MCPLCGNDAAKKFLRAPDRFHGRKEAYQLLRCGDCCYVWQVEPPAPEQMGVHYSGDYHRTIAKAGETAAHIRWRRHRELIKRYKSGGAILDIGCSSGAFLGTMKGSAWSLYGIEMEASTAEKARANTGAEVFVGDVMDAPFALGTFDAITSFDVLEHVYDPRAFLSRVFEWLRPGGMYFVFVPNIDSWEAQIFGSYWYGLELPRHISHFSLHSLRQLTSSLSFEEVHLRTPAITYLEPSIGYLFSAGLGRLGIKAIPLSQQKPAGVPRRLVRKALRVTLAEPLAAAASLLGAAGSIEGVFRKPRTGN